MNSNERSVLALVLASVLATTSNITLQSL